MAQRSTTSVLRYVKPPAQRAGRAAGSALSFLDERLSKPATAGLSALSILVVWQILTLFYPPQYLPGPAIVAGEMYAIVVSGEFGVHMIETVRRVIVGFVVALLIAVPLGIAMGSNDFLEDFFEVEVVVGITIPGLMWAMIMLMFFGVREIGAYFAVAVIVTPIIAINLWEGMKNVDNDLNEMARMFDASTYSKVTDVVLPQLLPYIFASSRFGLGLAWKVVVIIEMLGFSNGIGYMVTRSYQLFSTRGVLAWTLSFTFLMLVIEYGVLNYLEKRTLGWRPEVEVWSR